MTKFCASCGTENQYDLLAPKNCWKCKKSFSSAFVFEVETPKPRPSNKVISRKIEEDDNSEDNNEDYNGEYSRGNTPKLEVEIDTYRGTVAKFGDVAKSEKTGVGRRERPKQKKISDKEFWQQVQKESARTELDFE
jgi:hypothetical protein